MLKSMSNLSENVEYEYNLTIVKITIPSQ